MITTGVIVTFEAQKVAGAPSVTLDRFATLTKVVFFDVACELECGGMHCVRAPFFHHMARLCLHKDHAK